jgi:hypothetical protein
LEDLQSVIFLTELIGICFEHRKVPDTIFLRFCTLVVDIITAEYPDVLRHRDVNTLRRIICSFTAPSRTGDDDIGACIAHWMPLKKDENKTLKVLRRTLNEPEPQPKNSSGGGAKRKITSLTSRYDDFDTLEIFQEPVEVCRTYDRPQHSMNILAKLIPDAENCLVIDIYSARRPITDRNGTRLQGTQPYANDIHVPKHHGHCKVQLENNKGTWVMLAGLPVMRWFEAIWGKVTTQGQIVNIGGRDVST